MRNDLKTLRARHGLSQQVLADIPGVSRQTVNSLEGGRYDPSLPLAIRIARHFEMAVESIVHLDEG